MKLTIFLFLFIAANGVLAQNYSFNFNTTGRRVCLVEAETDLNIPSVTIKFLDAASNTTSVTNVYRRALYGTGTDWVQVATALPAGTVSWTDTDVNAGESWEYQVKRPGTWVFSGQTYDATGYALGSLLEDKAVYQGRMILLVAENIAESLPEKYLRLKRELTGEGWFVNELIVPRANGWESGDTVVGIRNEVISVYNNAPSDDKPKMLFILGHVPMPRSGSTTVTAPDAHNENKGARGCDGYYADIDGVYTDVATFNPGGLQTPFAINLPGDFKWDQDFYPSALEMAFGRVDFADLVNFAETEIQLTERYLDRLSNYKNVVSGSDIGDKTGFWFGYDNSNDGSYRSMPLLSKSANVYQNTAGTPHPQWIQNNGPFKFYMQNQSFPEIGEWQTYGMNATVFSSDQSYWGFNDQPQSFYYSRIRALLALDTKCLVTLWSTSALNTFYQACTGDPFGLAVKENMNYNTTTNNMERPEQSFDTDEWWNRTHFAYNGDPTIRLYQLAPPTDLTISYTTSEAVLSWNASPDEEVSGYHIYKSNSELGIYERITTVPVATLSFSDESYQQFDWYMVRAVKTTESGCGKFLNPSIGITVMGDIPLALNENSKGTDISIFPNPVENEVSVIAAHSIESLELIDQEGKSVYELENIGQDEVTFYPGKLSSGIYFLRIVTAEGIVMKKVVVN